MISTYDAPWISVHKEMPDADTTVLLHTPDDKSEPVQAGFHNGRAWCDYFGGQIYSVVTHWLHFPNPPKT